MENCFAWSDEGKDGSSSSSLKGPFNYIPPSPWQSAKPSSSSSEGRDSTALRIHSEAEKRRRERINVHLSTLRRMVPNSAKMDKASLLGTVIDHLKDLKRKAVGIDCSIEIPAEFNEVKVELVDVGNQHEFLPAACDDKLYIKASVCCDDRADLFQNLIKAFNRLRLTTIRADMMSLGGRVQNVFVLCLKDFDTSSSVSLSCLKRSIRDMLDSVISCSEVPTSNVFSSKKRKSKNILHCV
ncbi:hypothetical protein Cni_G25389 [Canna indica]|uniref:BHLH domain-containing protein n=1 Tax=Canna indica TaxID=4628 RepID=A0AAQ3L1T2_9LILI|nr:hypothetical protein Cni_G25389 [Canna indica]